jgi:hypothetical protein
MGAKNKKIAIEYDGQLHAFRGCTQVNSYLK